MKDGQLVPYGSWQSPITSDLIVSGGIGLELVGLDEDTVYWTEARPTEAGRVVIVQRASNGATSDVIPPPFNARTRVHEYGGGAVLVAAGVVFFSNFTDQQLYRVRRDAEPQPLTKAAGMRYADAVLDGPRNRLICVREDHTVADREAANTIVSIDLTSGVETVLVSGSDFYATPRLSSDSRLCWLAWDHPNMPWDGCVLRVASWNPDGTLGAYEQSAGGRSESIFQPQWAPDGSLYFVSDRSGWWNLYGVVARIVTGPHDTHRRDPHLPMRYDTGRPRAVIRLRISQPRTTSLLCPAGLRARRPSPMMDLYRKNTFSTRL